LTLTHLWHSSHPRRIEIAMARKSKRDGDAKKRQAPSRPNAGEGAAADASAAQSGVDAQADAGRQTNRRPRTPPPSPISEPARSTARQDRRRQDERPARAAKGADGQRTARTANAPGAGNRMPASHPGMRTRPPPAAGAEEPTQGRGGGRRRALGRRGEAGGRGLLARSANRWLDSGKEREVRDFVAARGKQAAERKYQLSLIKDFVENPSRFGLDPGRIPTSTAPEEFAERRSELEYRIAMARTLLQLLDEELQMLTKAEAFAQNERAEGGE
jgi:hypothetical protein